MTNFDEVDFFRDNSVVSDPYPYFDELRSKNRIIKEPHHDVYMVTGYDEAVAIYNDVERFSSCISTTGPFPGFPVPLAGRDDIAELIEKHRPQLPFNDQLPTMDPPAHKQHRGLMMRLITPKRLKENEDFMWRRADQFMDEYVERGAVELINEFAGPFTLYVIADFLGVPEEHHEMFREELQGPNRRMGGSAGSTKEGEVPHAPLEFLYGRFSTYIEDRRKEPRNDWLSEIAQATFPDGSLPEVLDVVRIAANIFSAGQETTVRLLGTAFQVMGERPDVQDLLRRDRELIPNFIEECLRHQSPVKGDFRLAKVDAEVGGVVIPAGSVVMVLNGAASRDPARFPDPDEFDLARPNSREHLAFGRGIHACPGGPLARSETRVAVERFLDRTSSISISEEHHGPAGARRYEYLPTFILRGLRQLHLELEPAS